MGQSWVGSPVEGVENVQIDSRKCGRGTLFVPLKGERTDGHLYLKDIAGAGTKLSLVDHKWYSENRGLVEELVSQRDMAFLPVAGTLEAMQQLAVYHMSLFPDLTVVGITGSNGKTTTKEILGAILSEFAETVVNEGNLNSDIGLPLSVFRVEERHEIAVFEMGMNREGEMDLLASIVKPDYAVITNIGTAHIGMLGSRDAIAQAKKQIFSCFDGKQTAIIPADDSYSDFLAEGIKGRVVFYGPEVSGPVRLVSGFSIEGCDLEIEGRPCHFSLPGEHNLANVRAAVAAAVEMGVDSALIARGIDSMKPLFGRGELIKGDITVLRDCYNANPDSTEQSLKLLRFWENRSVAVLGDMLELGDASREEHRRIGGIAAESGAEALFLFGKEMEEAFEAVRTSGYPGYSFWTIQYEELEAAVKEYVKKGDLVLLKGSRGVALERLTPLLT
nr:UDP-N-acetylmuramoyl-tripeptide--D-alanyl-D-alanine ligase [Spirochaeta isovalerica]